MIYIYIYTYIYNEEHGFLLTERNEIHPAVMKSFDKDYLIDPGHDHGQVQLETIQSFMVKELIFFNIFQMYRCEI